EKAGANYKARCPFHNEKTPSFYVSAGRNSYYCFGCAAKGDIFTFVQEFEKVDFVGALKILAERAGIELQSMRNENKGETDRLRGVIEASAKYYESELSRNAKAIQYLKDRGLVDKTISDWRIGYAPNEWRKAHEFLAGKRISDADMEAVGLIKWPEDTTKSKSPYDRFRARIMFPLFDASSRIIGFSGRIFGVPDTDGPKYLNSPDTVLFNKSETLYGFHKAKEGIREWQYAILVEGQMDLLMCHQSGFTNAVATSGTSLTSQHLDKLKKLSDNLMLVYDADKAGLKATLRAWTGALAIGMGVKVAGLPTGEDPASLLLKDKEEFKKALKNSKHIIEYYLDILTRESKKEGASQEKFKKSIGEELLPYVAVIESAIARSGFISKISLGTGIREDDIRMEVEKIMKDNAQAQAGQPKKEKEVSRDEEGGYSADGGNGANGGQSVIMRDPSIRRLVGLVQWLESKKDVDSAQAILERIGTLLAPDEFSDFKMLVSQPKEELIFEAEVLFQGSSKLSQEIEHMVDGIEDRMLKESLSKAMSDLKIAEGRKDMKKIEELLARCQKISLQLSELNRKRASSH
ncbi:MAG TPA: DNA primase, partial [Candidatus Paceibacterota bacterium]